jgi:hypothetical protein
MSVEYMYIIIFAIEVIPLCISTAINYIQSVNTTLLFTAFYQFYRFRFTLGHHSGPVTYCYKNYDMLRLYVVLLYGILLHLLLNT